MSVWLQKMPWPSWSQLKDEFQLQNEWHQLSAVFSVFSPNRNENRTTPLFIDSIHCISFPKLKACLLFLDFSHFTILNKYFRHISGTHCPHGSELHVSGARFTGVCLPDLIHLAAQASLLLYWISWGGDRDLSVWFSSDKRSKRQAATFWRNEL